MKTALSGPIVRLVMDKGQRVWRFLNRIPQGKYGFSKLLYDLVCFFATFFYVRKLGPSECTIEFF